MMGWASPAALHHVGVADRCYDCCRNGRAETRLSWVLEVMNCEAAHSTIVIAAKYYQYLGDWKEMSIAPFGSLGSTARLVVAGAEALLGASERFRHPRR